MHRNSRGNIKILGKLHFLTKKILGKLQIQIRITYNIIS